MNQKPASYKEKRIRSITHLYYSKPEVQKAMFEFCKNREISPQYFDGFGKRPDSFQYPGDVYELAKKGATSFHCSEELWKDPMEIITGMNEKQSNNLRIGWDLLIDIDCKWFDYAKLAAKAIIETFKQHGIKNIGIKFSGSKGFHLLIPWKAFPEKINDEDTKNLFPDLPRKIVAYIRHYSEKIMKENLPDDFYSQFKNVKIKKGIKCKQCGEIADAYEQVEFFCKFCKRGEYRKFDLDSKKNEFKCPQCKKPYEIKNTKEIFHCSKCNITSEDSREKFKEAIEVDLFELMGLDLVLVSPRHLFRAPYSLHEKTALASIVIDEEELEDFEIMQADPMKIKIKEFTPNSSEGEASELLMQAFDWFKEQEIVKGGDSQKISGKYAEFKPIKLDNIEKENFPPCVAKILNGLTDGRKRAVFVLINFFRSIGMEKQEMEKYIEEWNKKNEIPLKQGYINSQLSWSYKRKPILPPNCKEFYKGLGICAPDNFCNIIKNPVNYTIRKTLSKKKTKKPVKNKKNE